MYFVESQRYDVLNSFIKKTYGGFSTNLLKTTCLLVAEKFGKEHRNVMKNIKQFISSAENPAVLSMFVENSYIASNGKENPMYVMNRDGFTLLAMGVTGQKTISGHFHK